MRKRTAYIRQYIQDHIDKTNAELAEDLYLTVGGVRSHIRALGLQGVRPRGRKSAGKHDDYIREHYPFQSSTIIAKELGMTSNGVKCTARRLGVKHNPVYKKDYPIKENLVGQRFGRLIPQRQLGTNKHGQMRYECLCDCGNTTEAIAGNLKHGNQISCGCLRKERIKEAKQKRKLG